MIPNKYPVINKQQDLTFMSYAPTSVGTQDTRSEYHPSSDGIATQDDDDRYLRENALKNYRLSYRKRSHNCNENDYNFIPTFTKEPSSLISTLIEKLFQKKRRKIKNVPKELENGKFIPSFVGTTTIIPDPHHRHINPVNIDQWSYNNYSLSHHGNTHCPVSYPDATNFEGNEIYDTMTKDLSELSNEPYSHKHGVPTEFLISGDPSHTSPILSSLKQEIKCISVSTLGGLDFYDPHEQIYCSFDVHLDKHSDTSDIGSLSIYTSQLSDSADDVFGNNLDPLDDTIEDKADILSVTIPTQLEKEEKSPNTALWEYIHMQEGVDFKEDSGSHYSDAISELNYQPSMSQYTFESLDQCEFRKVDDDYISPEKLISIEPSILSPNLKSPVDISRPDLFTIENSNFNNPPDLFTTENPILNKPQTEFITENSNLNKPQIVEVISDQFYKIKSQLIKKLRELNQFQSIPHYTWHTSRILTSTNSMVFSPYKIIFEGYDINTQSEDYLKNICRELDGLYHQYINPTE